jgi:hypothetical protein
MTTSKNKMQSNIARNRKGERLNLDRQKLGEKRRDEKFD